MFDRCSAHSSLKIRLRQKAHFTGFSMSVCTSSLRPVFVIRVKCYPHLCVLPSSGWADLDSPRLVVLNKARETIYHKGSGSVNDTSGELHSRFRCIVRRVLGLDDTPDSYAQPDIRCGKACTVIDIPFVEEFGLPFCHVNTPSLEPIIVERDTP